MAPSRPPPPPPRRRRPAASSTKTHHETTYSKKKKKNSHPSKFMRQQQQLERPLVEDFLAETFVCSDNQEEKLAVEDVKKKISSCTAKANNSVNEERTTDILPVGTQVEVGITICGEKIFFSGQISGFQLDQTYDIDLPDGSIMQGVKREDLNNIILCTDSYSSNHTFPSVQSSAQQRYRRSRSAPVEERHRRSSVFQSLFRRFKNRRNHSLSLTKLTSSKIKSKCTWQHDVHVDDHRYDECIPGNGDGELLLSVLPPPMTTIDFNMDNDPDVFSPEVATAGPTATTITRGTAASDFKTSDDSASTETKIKHEKEKYDDSESSSESVDDSSASVISEDPRDYPTPRVNINIPVEEDYNVSSRHPDFRSDSSRVVLKCTL